MPAMAPFDNPKAPVAPGSHGFPLQLIPLMIGIPQDGHALLNAAARPFFKAAASIFVTSASDLPPDGTVAVNVTSALTASRRRRRRAGDVESLRPAMSAGVIPMALAMAWAICSGVGACFENDICNDIEIVYVSGAALVGGFVGDSPGGEGAAVGADVGASVATTQIFPSGL